MGIEDRGTSLERGRDSILERHGGGIKPYFNEEDDLDSELDPIWSEDNKQATSDTRQEGKANQDGRKEPNRAKAAQQLWYPSQAWYRETVVAAILHQKSFKRREDEWQTRVLKDMYDTIRLSLFFPGQL